MNKTKEEVDLDVATTQDLAKKVFEIISILDDDPQRVIGALAVALGYSTAIYNCDLERSLKVVNAYNEKMKKMFEEFKDMSDTDSPMITRTAPNKESLN